MRGSLRLLAAGAAALCLVLAATAAGAGAKTVWLCRPGVAPDPCTPGLSTTVYSPTQQVTGMQNPVAVKNPKIDCFYV